MLIKLYDQCVMDDYRPLVSLSHVEKVLIGEAALLKRLTAITTSGEANKKLLTALTDDLPSRFDGEAAKPPLRPLLRIKEVRGLEPTQTYGTIASLLQGLMRDWSEISEGIFSSTYLPALDALRESPVRQGGEILVPGCGLCRLALEIVASGYVVEGNENSRLNLSAADWILNRAPSDESQRHLIYPLAHQFQENYSLANQYLECRVPAPAPSSVVESIGRAEGQSALTLVPGDFCTLYSPGGPRHRLFDGLVTCFFMDAVQDLVEFVALVSGLLPAGGVWVNIGPLQFDKNCKWKLSWEEIAGMFTRAGFDFTTQKMIECDYNVPRDIKMFSESFCCVLSVAVKRNAKTD